MSQYKDWSVAVNIRKDIELLETGHKIVSDKQCVCITSVWTHRVC
jgi:hypothetical protein